MEKKWLGRMINLLFPTTIQCLHPQRKIVTAFTLGIYLNFLLDRHLLAIKELFA